MNDMTRREFLTTATAFAATGVITASADEDGRALQEAKRWFKEAKFGLMAHWGLYSLAGGEWNGEVTGELSEWMMYNFKIPLEEYRRLARAFNPVLFKPLDWMKMAQDAGMKYFVVTSKHHDGFAMFRSKVSAYNVVDATPFKRDVIEEFAEACRSTGMKLGLYYSQDVDWSDQNGGGRFVRNPFNAGGSRMWGNTWDWTEKDEYDFKRYFYGKALPQVEEILTQYGDLCLVWFDCPNTATLEQTRELKALVRKLQPSCLVSGRIGHGLGDYESGGDNQLIEKTRQDRLYEGIGTMNDSWGYKPADTNFKSVETILELKRKNNSVGANYMLNVGPDGLGRFPPQAVKIMRGLAQAKSARG